MLKLLLSSLLLHDVVGFFFQPEQFMGPMEIITYHGYPAEEHKIITKDGYIITMHRIPTGRKGRRGGRPVLLLAGLACSSWEFLSPLPNKSLSYSLADAGYDVWLGNNRGNIYSMSHMFYSNIEPRYWNFSWDEMSSIDNPAMIDYILETTNQSDLYFVGFSQGATVFLASTDVHPNIQSKVNHFFAFGPGLSLAHLESPLFKLASLIPGIADAVVSLVPSQVLSAPFLLPFCSQNVILTFCKWIISDVVGQSNQLDDIRLAVFTAHYPAGTSNKNLRHWLQMMRQLAHFDYGEAGNRAMYGTPSPPLYNFTAYRVPTSLYFSPADKLINNGNMKVALDLIPASSITRSRNLTAFSHLDFVWGDRAKAEIYDEIIADIGKEEGTQ